jgi:hypothetical protein
MVTDHDTRGRGYDNCNSEPRINADGTRIDRDQRRARDARAEKILRGE